MKIKTKIEIEIVDGQTDLGYESALDIIEDVLNKINGVTVVKVDSEEVG